MKSLQVALLFFAIVAAAAFYYYNQHKGAEDPDLLEDQLKGVTQLIPEQDSCFFRGDGMLYIYTRIILYNRRIVPLECRDTTTHHYRLLEISKPGDQQFAHYPSDTQTVFFRQSLQFTTRLMICNEE